MFTVRSELVGTSVDLRQYRDPAFFAGLEPRIMAAAREAARIRAVSYRRFLVGACAAVLSKVTSDVVFLAAGNYSPRKGVPRYCAEMNILDQVDELSESQGAAATILDMCIAAPDDPKLIEEVTGKATPTLHSCAECRGRLQDHPAATDSMGVVTTGWSEGSPVERRTLGDMLALYVDVEPPKPSRQLLAEAGLVIPLNA